MIRFLLLAILLTFVVRAASVLWTGIIRGLQGQARGTPQPRGSAVPQQGVQMVRDPVCGTFVVRDRALPLAGTSGTTIYFCSTECRDKYRARPASPSSAHGRTA
jgi:YHS domain-containing protein